MNRQITISLLTIITCFTATKMYAYDIVATNEDGLNIYYNFINNKTELSVTYWSLASYYSHGLKVYRNTEAYYGNIRIPSIVSYAGNVYKITEIGDKAFYQCKNISVEMPNYLKSVSGTAFETASIDAVKASDFKIWCETDFGESHFSREDYHPFIKAKKVIINNKDFELPSELKVTCSKIGNNAFWGRNQIKKITMTESVKTIGVSAFYGCEQLSKVTIGSSVKSIGDNSFAKCSRLADLQMFNSVITIGNSAFDGCNRLYNIQISNNLQHIGDKAFQSIAITSLELPKSLLYIGDNAFASCKDLVSINFPPNLNYIGAHAFSNCSNLRSDIIIPDNVKEINNETFYLCDKIPSVSFGKSIERIGKGAFMACFALKIKGELPNSLITIEDEAFDNCRSFVSIEIPNSVKTIGSRAFDGCELKGTIILGYSIESIGSRAFRSSLPKTIISRMEDPCDIPDDTFWQYGYGTYGGDETWGTILYVPVGTKDLYQHTKGWKKFEKIEESELADISSNMKEDITINKVYSLAGNEQQNLKRGFNIIHQSDGKTKKVLIK